MSYKKKISKYKSKNVNFSLDPIPKKNSYKYFIVIPVYNEYDYLLETLYSINQQPLKYINELLVILVINNSNESDGKIIANNSRTHKLISQSYFKYEFIILDRYTCNNAFIKKISGVGVARKTGMDFALHYGNQNSLLCCLDADTLINKNYFKYISKTFQNKKIKICTLGFKHQKANTLNNEIAIRKYENKLKKIAFKIKSAGSPYGYVSMGSTIVCNFEAYIAVGGMSKKSATEDFYFLQSLAKHTTIHYLNKTLVYPSARCEERIYLGTGYRMIEYKNNNKFKNLSFQDCAYNSLKNMYEVVNHYWGKDCSVILNLFKNKSENALIKFLDKHNFQDIWEGIRSGTKTKKQFMLFFNQWFDALKVMKLLKELS